MIHKTIDTLYVGAKVFKIYNESTQRNYTLTLYLCTPIKYIYIIISLMLL